MSPKQRHRRIPQALLLAIALISGTLATLFGFFYFSFYWPYRCLFNEEGRYFDGRNLVVYHEQNGLLIVPALAFLASALFFAVVWWVRRRPVGSITDGP
ncbi:hypothetical protein CPBF426_30280 [Xanthomonas arboricola pv. juglandis]|uniref:hypothetical protein n=1 Tax=Xanthomonas TaxID=338 RepID=UPI000E7E5BCB|nr:MULTISPECIES: hypothetical protein [Xanthomonas]MBB3812896.1 putative membrane protein [Xanthomonas euroxanthea]CAD1786732.1 hypothetical protein XSP_000359 [Xanthomonas sp. CPBF 426]CAG2083374.1 hypothetical protein XCY_000358 [Xanthomonas euroxanthea]SYZ55465.1 hypothetical protein CPBF426_30280 [Xanthomonas arboricola pv. juglandis]